MTKMRLVIVESPYGATGDPKTVRDNVLYAREACKDCLLKGESAWGSHIIWTQFLDDNNPADRTVGMFAGLAWSRVADYHAFYTDRGWSSGMLSALEHCLVEQKAFRVRSLLENGVPQPPPQKWLDERPGVTDYIRAVMEGYK